jgi:hypothetical protein
MHGHKHFQAVNIQFVDRNGQLIQLLLDLIDVDSEGSKTGAYLAILLNLYRPSRTTILLHG